MKCLKCLKSYRGRKLFLDVSKDFMHLEKWGVCESCSETMNQYRHEYYIKNKEHYKGLHKEYRANLADYYVANQLVFRTSLKAKDIPKEMVQAKRQIMKFNRLIKENNNEEDNK